MDQESLRQQFYDELRCKFPNKSLFQRAWDRLDKAGRIGEVEDWDEEHEYIDDWKIEIQRYIEKIQQGDFNKPQEHPNESDPKREQNHKEPFIGPSEWERLKAATLSTFVLRIASRDPLVKNVRMHYVGKQLAQIDDIRILDESPAVRFLTLEQFQEWRIPLFKHGSSIEGRPRYSEIDGEIFHSVKLRISANGDEQPRKLKSSDFYFEDIVIDAASTDGEPALDPTVKKQICWRGSVRDELMQAARNLAQRYALHERDALAFLLTGMLEATQVLSSSVISAQVPGWSHRIIRLDIEPWVPVDSVARTYKALQSKMLDKSRKGIGLRNAALFSFVQQQIAENDGETPLWQDTRDRWNECCERLREQWSERFPKLSASGKGNPADWKYDDDSSNNTKAGENNASRDYRETMGSLLEGYRELPIANDSGDDCYGEDLNSTQHVGDQRRRPM